MARVKQMLSGEPCPQCGSELGRIDCPAPGCDVGELHHADGTSHTCMLCSGTAELWWCTAVACTWAECTLTPHQLQDDEPDRYQ